MNIEISPGLLLVSITFVDMETKDGIEAVYAKTRTAWRNWLKKNGQKKEKIWLILYHKKSTVKSVTIDEAMEEAVCFGWVDSKAKKRDAESFYLTYTPRKAKSNWSQPNIDRAEKMIAAGLMTEHGLKLIDIAKGKGKWTSP